jgi:hypothetical protein
MRGTKKATKCGVAWIGAAGMAEHFGHERLKVYQKGMPFASMRKTLLGDLPRRVASMLRPLSKAVRDDI